ILTVGIILGFFALTVGKPSASEIFMVYPSDGDDTANIQAAFEDAKAAGPESTVQLAVGQFYTNAIFVEDFYGNFKGAGKDLTTIDVLKGKYPEEEGVVGPYGNHLFTFEGGDIYISDLGFEITPEKPAEESYDGTYDLFTILITGQINSRIERVKFTGHEGDQSGYPEGHSLEEKTYNVRLGVEYGGGLNGRHTITKCEFESLWLGITAWRLLNCEVKISLNSIKGGAIGIINAVSDNSKFEISRNDIETTYFGGIWVLQDLPDWESASQWLITHNTIKVLSDDSDGIFLGDFSSFKSLEAVVSHNKIILVDVNYGGIWTSFLQDTIICNNIIRGTGDYGIGCAYAYNNLLLGNNVQNVDASWAPVVLIFATECVVVGGSTKTNVLNMFGTNNLIVGMNNMQDNSLGQEIQEAMEQKRELIQSFPKF
ncbi:MAG: right-handed parallel beta-helix repeat-containing protein, partial [Promethearchaeia archaeon]